MLNFGLLSDSDDLLLKLPGPLCWGFIACKCSFVSITGDGQDDGYGDFLDYRSKSTQGGSTAAG